MSSIGKPERVTQNRVIGLFRDQLGYRYVGDWGDRPGNSNIEEELLKGYLTKCNYSPEQISRAIYLLKAEAENANRSLYENNKAVYGLLRYGVPVKIEAGKVTDTVKLINWAEPQKNDFVIADWSRSCCTTRLTLAAVARDPVRHIRKAGDPDPLVVEDADRAPARQLVDAKRLAKFLQQRSDQQHAAQLAAGVLDGARDRKQPEVAGLGDGRTADREALAGEDLCEVVAILGAEAMAARIADVVAVEGDDHDLGDIVRQFRFQMPQQGIVGLDVPRVCRDRIPQAGHQVFDIAEMIIDLGGNHPSFGERALKRLRLLDAGLIPQADAEQHQERQGRRRHEAEELRTDALKLRHARPFPVRRGR